MIAGKKLFFVSQRKLPLSLDNYKNDTAEFFPPVPGTPGYLTGGFGDFVFLCVYSFL